MYFVPFSNENSSVLCSCPNVDQSGSYLQCFVIDCVVKFNQLLIIRLVVIAIVIAAIAFKCCPSTMQHLLFFCLQNQKHFSTIFLLIFPLQILGNI